MRVGVFPLISADAVARAHSAVVSSSGCGGSSLVLREADLRELCTALDGGGLDLIVVPAVLPLTRYRRRLIGSEPVVLVEPGSGGAGDPGASSALPAAGGVSDSPAVDVVEVEEVAHRILLLVPDTCGLTAFTRGLLSDRGLPLRAYSGEAASYRVLEDWAGMGLGSALLPRSKVTSADSCVRTVVDADGAAVMIAYEAVWDAASPIAEELEVLAGFLASGRAEGAGTGRVGGGSSQPVRHRI